MGNYNQVYMSDEPLYSEDEVKTIVDVFESSQFKVTEPESKKSFTGNKKSRVSCVLWPELKNYLRKFERFIFDTNEHLFKYDLIPLDDSHSLNLNYYDLKNPSYDWHMDGTKNFQNYDLKLTVLLNVSTQKYTGGNLKLFNISETANEIIVNKFKTGYCLIFTSNHFHKVEPVTKGVRKTLSYWAKGPLWK
jgi:PKHD-type hydroxylase